MSEQKFTPGPWRVFTERLCDRLLVDVVTAETCNTVCEFSGDEQQDLANALLIAAAPELLAACQEFVRKCECGEASSKRSYAQMKAAIEKAAGRETPVGG